HPKKSPLVLLKDLENLSIYIHIKNIHSIKCLKEKKNPLHFPIPRTKNKKMDLSPILYMQKKHHPYLSLQTQEVVFYVKIWVLGRRRSSFLSFSKPKVYGQKTHKINKSTIQIQNHL